MGDGIFCGNFAGGFAACGRRVTFWTARKSPKNRQGGGSGWTLRVHIRRPLEPHYGGRVLVRVCNISGAQNLSGFPQFNPANWAWVYKNFNYCAFRTAPDFVEPTLLVRILAGAPRDSPTQDGSRPTLVVGEGLAPPPVHRSRPRRRNSPGKNFYAP